MAGSTRFREARKCEWDDVSTLIFGGIIGHFSGLVDADGVYTINIEANVENSCCYLGVSEEIIYVERKSVLN